jgi:hypothetical protein
MNTANLNEYAKLKIEEKRIKARIEELGPQIRQEIVLEGFDKVPTNLGNFNIKSMKKWTYSEAVKQAEANIKTLKATEEQDGTATYVEVQQLEFREKKETNGTEM